MAKSRRGSRIVKKFLIALAILPSDEESGGGSIYAGGVRPIRHHLSDATRTLSVDHADGLSCPMPFVTQPTDRQFRLINRAHACDARHRCPDQHARKLHARIESILISLQVISRRFLGTRRVFRRDVSAERQGAKIYLSRDYMDIIR